MFVWVSLNDKSNDFSKRKYKKQKVCYSFFVSYFFAVLQFSKIYVIGFAIPTASLIKEQNLKIYYFLRAQQTPSN